MSGLTIGKIILEEVDSTNSYAKKNIGKISDRTAVIAKCQTSGRGRLNRSWVDLGDGNLFLSIVLKPSNSYHDIYSNLTQYLSVVLCKVLEEYGLQPQIKWPNDVLINNKKIAGILAETVMNANCLKGVILGIGVNLNSNQEDINNIPNKIATALNIEINKHVNIEEFTDKLLDKFFENYDEFINTGFSNIKDDYIKRNCFLNNEIKVQVFNRTEEGLAQEINNKGELILKNKNNQNVTLMIGDIL